MNRLNIGIPAATLSISFIAIYISLSSSFTPVDADNAYEIAFNISTSLASYFSFYIAQAGHTVALWLLYVFANSLQIEYSDFKLILSSTYIVLSSFLFIIDIARGSRRVLDFLISFNFLFTFLSSYYTLVLLFSAERMLLGFIFFFLYILCYSNPVAKYFFAFLTLTTHITFAILFLAYHSDEIKFYISRSLSFSTKINKLVFFLTPLALSTFVFSLLISLTKFFHISRGYTIEFSLSLILFLFLSFVLLLVLRVNPPSFIILFPFLLPLLIIPVYRLTWMLWFGVVLLMTKKKSLHAKKVFSYNISFSLAVFLMMFLSFFNSHKGYLALISNSFGFSR